VPVSGANIRRREETVQAYYAEQDDQAEVEDIGDAQSNAKEYTENTGPVRKRSATLCKFPPCVEAPANSKQS